MGFMQMDIKPASDYPIPDLVQVLNRSFENYIVPIRFEPSQFLTMLHKDNIDLGSSRVLLFDNQPSGIALIARRGWTSRLAAMGVAMEVRGKGFGTKFMEQLILEARNRNDREMVLEVIEKNEPAVRMYQKCEFETVRRLISLIHRDSQQEVRSGLQEIDLREMGWLILHHGIKDLPWQLSGETISLLSPPTRAYKRGEAYIAISNPDAEHVVVWSLLVETQARGKGLSAEILETIISNHADKIWHVPAICPEEFGRVFEHAGFQREELSQWQMRLVL